MAEDVRFIWRHIDLFLAGEALIFNFIIDLVSRYAINEGEGKD